MNIDRRIIGAGHGPSDDSGSDGEENLRVSRVLKTHEQVLDSETGLSLKWPSVCKVIPERIQHSKINVSNECLYVYFGSVLFVTSEQAATQTHSLMSRISCSMSVLQKYI